MENIYPHKWSSKLGKPEKNNSAFQTWRNGLSGITPGQIARGLEHCIRSGDAWPPSLPQFREYCEVKPEELGLPSLEQAYQVARQQHPDWSQLHPIVYHARRAVGMPEMVTEADNVIRSRFERAYQSLVAQVLAGEVFEMLVITVPQLEHQRPRQITASGDARAHIQAIRAMISGGVSVKGKS